MRRFLLLLLMSVTLLAQRQIPENLRQATLDDFTTPRLGAVSGTPLFFPATGALFANISLETSGGQLVSKAATAGYFNSYFWNKDSGAYATSTASTSYLKNRLQSGTWSSDFNRMSFRWRCSTGIAGSTHEQYEFGTYAHDPLVTDTSSGQETDGFHFYHMIIGNRSPWRWVWATLNAHPQAMREDRVTGENLTIDPTLPKGKYFDIFTNFYLDELYEPFTGSTCYFDDWVLGTQTGEPDYHVSTITYQYTGSRYEVAWQAGRDTPTTFEIRYSTTGSLKTSGFSSGTDAGTVTSSDSSPKGAYWISANMAESTSGLWVGIRPRMPVQSASAATPVSVGIYQHSLVTGDQVYCSGLGVTAAGNYTATVVDANTITLDSSTGSGSYTSGGYCKATSNTSRFTEVFIPLAPLAAPGFPLGVSFSGTTTTATTINFMPEYSATSTTAERRVLGQSWTVAGTTSTGSLIDNGLNPGTHYQYRLKSSNATGTGDYTDAHISYVYPSVTTTTDAAYPSFTTAALPDANVGTPYSKQLTVTGGTAPYTFSVDAGTLPIGLTISSTGAITGTPTTFTALPGAAITFKVTDVNNHNGYVGLYLPVNQLPAVDDFNRADNWVYGDWDGIGKFAGMKILNNQIKSDGYSGRVRSREWFSDDQWAEAKVTALGATEFIGPSVRNNTTSGAYVCAQTITQLCLYRYDPSANVAFQTCADAAWSTGDVIRAEAFDSTIRCFSNGALKVSITNADILTGAPGIAGRGGSDTLADDWSGGNISTPIITTETLLDAVVDYVYSLQLVAVRGEEPLVWSVVSGSLPTGLTLSSSGLLSGTPTTGGTASFTARVTGADSAFTNKALSLTVLAGVSELSVSTSTLTEGRTSVTYSHALTASGGLTPYVWSITSGTLPSGLSLSNSGVISGTPTLAGVTSLTFRVTDRLDTTADKTLNLIVTATVSASDNFNRGDGSQSMTTALGWSNVGSANSFFVASNAVRAYDSGSYEAGAKAYINLVPALDQYAIVKWKESSAGPAVRLKTTVANGYACFPVGGQLKIIPIVPGYYWGSVLAEVAYIPVINDEIKLRALGSELTCYVNGTAIVTATDTTYADGYTGIAGHSNGIVDDWEGGNIMPTPDIVTTSLIPGMSDVAYNVSLTVTSGTPPYTWSLASGTLPEGLTLYSAGSITGTPTTAGVSSFSVSVTDATALTDTQALSITISAPPPPPPPGIGSRLDGFLQILGDVSIQ